MKLKTLGVNLVDRIIFIGIGVLGTIATTYITGVMKFKTPELVVKQSYNWVDSGAPVATGDLELNLDYKGDPAKDYGIYRVDFANKGDGPEEDLRLQIKFSRGAGAVYYIEPDFRVFRPTLVEFEDGQFYLNIPKFPPNASARVLFRVSTDRAALAETMVKIVGESHEGRVEGLRE